jgi:hypothetical protein
MDLLPAYRALVESPEQSAFCAGASTLADLLQRLRQLWPQAPAGDGALVAALNDANRQALDLDPRSLEGRWFPGHYDAATRSVAWLWPQGHATEPFQEQYLARCRQGSVFNQLVQPRTPLAPLLSPATDGDAAPPAGFIFHLSRCGSTLLSGGLAELDDTSVLSESPLLTALLLDATLTDAHKRAALPRLVRLQAAPFAGRGRIIVKWNAWDLFQFPLIDAAFPGVPRVLLFREPEEILASHARSSGRHMAGDPALAALHPAFAPLSGQADLLDFRIGVLKALTETMLACAGHREAMPLDYAQLAAAGIDAACRHFGLVPSAAARTRIAQRLGVHSKAPDQPFEADSARKRQWFRDGDRQRIQRALAPGHRALKAAAGA